MEEIKSNPILEFNDNQLQNVRKSLGYEDVNKLKQDIEQLRNWILKQNHFRVKEFDEEFLERLLIYNKGSIERAKQKFDRLCTFTNLMPEFLQNFDMKNDFKHVFTAIHSYILPKPTDDNYRILVSHVTGDEDKEFLLLDFYRYIILISHYMLFNDYCLGYEWISDSRNITIGTILKFNPVIVQKGLKLVIEALGQRLRRIHVISNLKFFDTVITLVKQGVSPKFRDRILVHRNLESLYEVIPRARLPKELSGVDKTSKELNEIVFKELCSDANITKIKYMENIGTDESRRLVCKFNEEYSGMPGSFKTLCVD